jgi:hypothetical protein
MTGVVSLYGDEIRPPEEPDSDTVELVEKILMMAKSGEIQGIFAILERSNKTILSMSRIDSSLKAIGAMFQEATAMSVDLEEIREDLEESK